MKHTDGLFLSVFRNVAGDYPDVEPRENLVDALCMGLVQRPEDYYSSFARKHGKN